MQVLHYLRPWEYVTIWVRFFRAWVSGRGGRRVLTPGGLYLQRQYGLVLVAVAGEGGQQQRHTTGQVLVEKEAVRLVVLLLLHEKY